MQVGAAGDVDPQTIRRSVGSHWRIAHTPFRQPHQNGSVGRRIGVMHYQPGHQDLRLHQLHPGPQAEARGDRIH